MRNTRRGFTLLELMVVIVIMGILVRIALPRFQDMRDRAVAAHIIGAIKVVETGVYSYSAASNAWPPSASSGSVPKGLSSSLPAGFTFKQDMVKLRWQLQSVRQVEYGLIQAYPTTINICAKLYSTLGGDQNNSIAAACSGKSPRIDYYVDYSAPSPIKHGHD